MFVIAVFGIAATLPLTIAAQVSCPTLSFGSRGASVLALQRILYDAYADFPEPTGYFGRVTEAALKQLQKEKGIVSSGTPATTGWGAVGPRTARALGLCSASTAASAPRAGTTASAQSTSSAPRGVPLPPPFTPVVRGATSTASGGTTASTSGTSAAASTSTEPCTFGAVRVEHGSAVTAYRAARVPVGLTCLSQRRACAGGVLSGTFRFATCSADSPDPVPVFRTSNPLFTSWRARGATFATSSAGVWELVESAGSGTHQISYSTSTASSVTSTDAWRLTVVARPENDDPRSAIRVTIRNSNNAENSSNVVRCSLLDGGRVLSSTRGNESAEFAASIDLVGGWYRCRVEARLDLLESTQLTFLIQLENGAGAVTYAGDGESGVQIDNIVIENKRSFATADPDEPLLAQLASALEALGALLERVYSEVAR